MKNKYIVNLTERMVAFCDKCRTVRNLDVKQNKDGSLILVCEKCGYHNPIWKWNLSFKEIEVVTLKSGLEENICFGNTYTTKTLGN